MHSGSCQRLTCSKRTLSEIFTVAPYGRTSELQTPAAKFLCNALNLELEQFLGMKQTASFSLYCR